MLNVKALNIFVIMCGDRGYYSVRTSGSPFVDDPAEFTVYRNQINAERFIRKQLKHHSKEIERVAAIDPQTDRTTWYLKYCRARIEDWENAEVVRIVD